MAAPIIYVTEVIRFPKQDILNALKVIYPTAFGDKDLANLVSYGPDSSDETFMEFVFEEVGTNGIKSQIETIKFQQGSIIQLMAGISPDYFGDKKIEDLDYYEDEPEDSSLVKFVFKPKMKE
jgi:hypothetical protein